MAIYSCNLSSIGRTTHQPGTAGAHINYISRDDAHPVILAENMPYDAVEARTWLDRQERGMRKNARVIDKIRLALPRELDDVERAALVEAFMDDLCGDHRVPWFAGIHQTGKDEHNPHAHIAVLDRDLETGKRVLRLSDSSRDRLKAGLPGPKAVDWIRKRWEVVANSMLEQAGYDERIDRRSLEAQGIDRLPTIHEGPRAQHINASVGRPDSKTVVNGAGRIIDYPAIDYGQTRREYNAKVVDINLARAARSDDPEVSSWARFEQEQVVEDRMLEDQLAAERRKRTTERRLVSLRYLAPRRRVSAELRLKKRQAISKVRSRFQPKRNEAKKRHAENRNALRKKQRHLVARIARKISRTVRKRQLAQRRDQILAHRLERRQLSQAYHLARKRAEDPIVSLYGGQIEEINRRRSLHLEQVDELQEQSRRFDDQLLQRREAEREEARALTEANIRELKQKQKLLRQGSDTETVGDFRNASLSAKQNVMVRAWARVKQKEKNERENKDSGEGRQR